MTGDVRTRGGAIFVCRRGSGIGRAWLWRILMSCAALVAATCHAVDATWNYAVQASATVSSNPAQITLTWPEDTWATASYKPNSAVRRKPADAGGWGDPVALGAGATTFTDTNVQPGVAYEYEVSRVFQNPAAPEQDHVAYGYVLSGINVPFPDARGRVLLVVEDRVAAALAAQVATLQADLVGDGWSVGMITVSAGDAPPAVCQRIAAEYNAQRIDYLYLLGHVPVAKSGSTWQEYTGPTGIEQIPVAPDGHDPRPLSTDAYYADIDGAWTDANGDGVFENDSIPSAVEMAVGRVDFADLPGLGTDDLTLTARYLDKAHAFRTGALRFDHKALLGDRIGIDYQRAPAGGAYRNFSAFYGANAITAANTEDNAPDAERWISDARGQSFGWAFGSGGGGVSLISFMGTDGEYHSATSQNLAGDVHVGFYLLFGSFFIDWSQPDDLLRSALASPTAGLGAAWTGRPTIIVHRMGLGEPVGNGIRLTQNNDGSLYYSPTNSFRRSIHIAWLGDPTLRLEYPSAPGAVSGSRNGSTTTVTWQPSGDASSYVVYRATNPAGPFTRLTDSPQSATSYSDANSPVGATYLIRAVRLDQTASGTYQNPSTGVLWTSPTDGSSSSGGSTSNQATTASGLANLSTKLQVSPGTPAAAGLVVSGSAPKQLLIRAAGPALGAFGVSNPVSDPQIRLFDSSGAQIAANAGWGNDGQIAATGDAVGAFRFAAGSRDAALLVTLAPGSYTAQVTASSAGTVLLEVYATDANASAPSQLTNLSTRGAVSGGDGAMTAGVLITGSDAVRVLIRAVGPGLSSFGVSGVLSDPVLTLYRQQDVVARNDNWETAQSASVPLLGGSADVANAAASVGAFALQSGSRDAALVVTLSPGAYTAVVTGANGATGTALVEVYRLP